jgi:hypothetical protein
MPRYVNLALVVVLVLTPGAVWGAEAEVPLVEPFLISGKLAEGEQALVKHLEGQPGDAQARFGLGVLQFTQAVEQLSQSLYRFGMYDRSRRIGLPILRMPVPPNPEPAKIGYKQCREILQTLIDDLGKVEVTLAVIKGDVKLPLHFGRIKIDLNGDGQLADDETLWRLYSGINRGVERTVAEEFTIVFDKGDVAWLRGYCHVLMSVCEFALAHDGRELFERTGHLFFIDVDSPYNFLTSGRGVFREGGIDFADVVALIHLINLPVVEPQRMQAALTHLERVIALSRESWRDILAETDDDREWIPNPQQTGIIPGVQITQPMVEGWQEVLDEVEAILQGKKLIPFWRGDDERGINLRKVFIEPRTFDLVMWIQGTAAAPYLQEGPLSTPDTWQRFNQMFNGQFVGFAIWFN